VPSLTARRSAYKAVAYERLNVALWRLACFTSSSLARAAHHRAALSSQRCNAKAIPDVLVQYRARGIKDDGRLQWSSRVNGES